MSEPLRLGLFDLPEFGRFLDPPRPPRKNRVRPIARFDTSHNEAAAGSAVRGDRVARLLRIARRTPEVVVKVTGTNAEASPLKAHLRYLTQKSKDPVVEDQDGNRLEASPEGRRELLERWGLAVEEGRRQEMERTRELAALREKAEREGVEFVSPPPGPRRTVAVHISLSMPQGTPAAAVLTAARGFAAEELSNHEYILVLHQDRAHPHVHVLVNNIGHDLRPMSRNREDLQRWREVFARELRDLGVEAEATPRKARGVIRKPENRRLTMLNDKARAARDFSGVRVTRAKVAQAANELRGVAAATRHPAELRARENRTNLEKAMRDAVVTLETQGEQGSRAATLVAGFLADMPPPETEMDLLRRALGAQARERTALAQGREPEPPELEKR